MSRTQIPGGVVHDLPRDLREELIASPVALDAWKDITPLARNEFICWVERRPCGWSACTHRGRTGRATRPVSTG